MNPYLFEEIYDYISRYEHFHRYEDVLNDFSSYIGFEDVRKIWPVDSSTYYRSKYGVFRPIYVESVILIRSFVTEITSLAFKPRTFTYTYPIRDMLLRAMGQEN